MERLGAVPVRGLVVEGTIGNVLEGVPYSKVAPRSVLGGTLSWFYIGLDGPAGKWDIENGPWEEGDVIPWHYRIVPVAFCDTRAIARDVVKSLMRFGIVGRIVTGKPR